MSIKELKSELLKIAKVRSAISLLQWDLSTYMPPKGASWRAEVLGELSEYAFFLFTSERMGNLIEKAQEEAKSELELALVRLTRKDYEKYRKIPLRLFVELQKEKAIAEKLWEEARKDNNFLILKDSLKKIVKMVIDIAEHIGYEDNRYDALLDEYEPGFKTSYLKEICDYMKRALIPLLERVESSDLEKEGKGSLKKGSFPIDKQRELIQRVISAFGFDLYAGRLDTSPHPFTEVVGLNDVRITTRYDEADPFQALLAAMHECGHALYDLNIPKEFFGLPIGDGASAGMHEGQARFWENIVGRSLPFLTFLKPILDSTFPSLSEMSVVDIWKKLNTVRRSLIRVSSDEITYNLHIIVRFELEEAMINERLSIEDLPYAWDEKMNEYLGIRPDNHRNGVLQDIHWASGHFGYFPSYMLGNIYAGQIYWKLKENLPDLDKMVSEGNFKAILEWFKENIYSKGKFFEPLEMIKAVTRENLSPSYLVRYLEEKFLRNPIKR